jgi:hypothetical protein
MRFGTVFARAYTTRVRPLHTRLSLLWGSSPIESGFRRLHSLLLRRSGSEGNLDKAGLNIFVSGLGDITLDDSTDLDEAAAYTDLAFL